MANDLNQCNFIGRLGKDPETRYTASGDAVTNFSIACSESWNNKNTGQKQEKTEWINIVVFKKLAEICGEWLKKGTQVHVTGKFTTEKWQDQSGNDRYSTKIIGNSVQMLGSRDDSQQQRPAQQPPQQPQNQGYQNQAQQQQYAQAPQQNAAPQQFEDDIPF